MTLFYVPHAPAIIHFICSETDTYSCYRMRMQKCITSRSPSLLWEMSLNRNVEAIFTPTAAEVNDNVNLMSVRSFGIW